MDVCDVCDFVIDVHTETELETCNLVRLFRNLLEEIEGEKVTFTIGSGTDNGKIIYMASIERHDNDEDVTFFGEGSTALEAITELLK